MHANAEMDLLPELAMQTFTPQLIKVCPTCRNSLAIENFQYRGGTKIVCLFCFRKSVNAYRTKQFENRTFQRISRAIKTHDLTIATKIIDVLVTALRGERNVVGRYRIVFDRLPLERQVDGLEAIGQLDARLSALEAERLQNATMHAVDVALGELVEDEEHGEGDDATGQRPDVPEAGPTRECRKCDRVRPIDRFRLKHKVTLLRARNCESCLRFHDRLTARIKSGKKPTERQKWRLTGMRIVTLRRICRFLTESFGGPDQVGALLWSSINQLPQHRKLIRMIALAGLLTGHREQMEVAESVDES